MEIITAAEARNLSEEASVPDHTKRMFDIFYREVRAAASRGEYFVLWAVNIYEESNVAFIKGLESLGYTVKWAGDNKYNTYNEIKISWDK